MSVCSQLLQSPVDRSSNCCLFVLISCWFSAQMSGGSSTHIWTCASLRPSALSTFWWYWPAGLISAHEPCLSWPRSHLILSHFHSFLGFDPCLTDLPSVLSVKPTLHLSLTFINAPHLQILTHTCCIHTLYCSLQLKWSLWWQYNINKHKHTSSLSLWKKINN